MNARPPMRSRASSTSTETPFDINSFAAVSPGAAGADHEHVRRRRRGMDAGADGAEQRACTEALQDLSAIQHVIALRHTLSLER